MTINKETLLANGKNDLPGTLEFFVDDAHRSLLTLVDLTTTLDRELMRLGELASTSNREIPIHEIRPAHALLSALEHELERLSADTEEITGVVMSAMQDGGINPIVPDTWLGTPSARTFSAPNGEGAIENDRRY